MQSSGEPPSAARTAWWLWPHLLSLDAPLVAVVWQHWWARFAGVRLRWENIWILGAGVWIIYVADRLGDTASTALCDHETARHAFYQRERRWLWPVAGTIFAALAGIAPCRLPVRQFVLGLGLLGLASGYFWLIHRRRGDDWPRFLPKEAVVAGMFVIGTAFFVVDGIGWPPPMMDVVYGLFGGLCFLNCALITKWERNPADLRDHASLINAFPRLTAHLGLTCVGLAALSAVLIGVWRSEIFLPVALAAILLAALNRGSDLFGPDVLRVLADVALLTPWLCAFYP